MHTQITGVNHPLQSCHVKSTPLYYINELIIWKLNLFVVPNNTFILKIWNQSLIIIIIFTRNLIYVRYMNEIFLQALWDVKSQNSSR